MTRRAVDTWWAAARAAAGLLIAAAIVAQADVTIGGAVTAGRDAATTIVNFFSFFTILSNVGAAIVLLWAAVWLLRARGDAATEPRGLALTLASVSTYMIVTGIVYNALLRGIPLPQGTTVPWSNEVLHVVGPLFLLADVLFAPRRRCLGRRAVLIVLVFPIVWVVYTLVRGPLVVNPVDGSPWWYPYPFLDPHSATTGGYGGVIAYVAGIAVAIAIVAAGVVWVGRRRDARRRAGATAIADV